MQKSFPLYIENFQKKYFRALKLSFAVCESFVTKLFLEAYENPTPLGDYKYIMLAFLLKL